MKKKNSITVILVVNNEEKLVRRCLNSLKDLSKEIIVIHDGKCFDNSLKIASEFTDNVFEKQKYGAMEPHLVDALYMSKNEWISRLDTDECLSSDLIEHIAKLNLKNTSFTHFKAKWRTWNGNVILKCSPYLERIVLFNKKHSVSIGIPHRSVSVSGPSMLLNGYLEHTPAYINYGFRELIFKKLKPFALIDARLRYSKPIKIYPQNSKNLIPKKDVIRNKYPILTSPLFVIHTYLKSLLELRKARTFFLFKIQIAFAHAHLVSQILLSYYMYKEKCRKRTKINKK